MWIYCSFYLHYRSYLLLRPIYSYVWNNPFWFSSLIWPEYSGISNTYELPFFKLESNLRLIVSCSMSLTISTSLRTVPSLFSVIELFTIFRKLECSVTVSVSCTQFRVIFSDPLKMRLIGPSGSFRVSCNKMCTGTVSHKSHEPCFRVLWKHESWLVAHYALYFSLNFLPRIFHCKAGWSGNKTRRET